MNQLKTIPNKEFLQELKIRITEKKINKEELFQVLESQELITEYEAVNLDNLTAEDWKKAYQALEKDKNYQEEVKLWESIDDEQDN